MEILGYSLALLVGISLGLIGSGGSILTVPILVYVFGVEPSAATTYSLFIVGVTALVGGAKNIQNRNFDWKSLVYFGLPSILSIYLTRAYVFPAIPNLISITDELILSKSLLLMVIFAIFMVLSAYKMIRPSSNDGESVAANKGKWMLLFYGIIVGMITGIIGIGGGFLIIPALVLGTRMEIKKAIGTSLVIISANALIGFLGTDTSSIIIDYQLMIYFSIASILGMFCGIYFARFADAQRLKTGFGWFILVMGLYIIVREIFL
jgi:uncharacterized membrane protein YfcA